MDLLLRGGEYRQILLKLRQTCAAGRRVDLFLRSREQRKLLQPVRKAACIAYVCDQL